MLSELPRPTRESLPFQRRGEHLASRGRGTQYDNGPARCARHQLPAVQGDGRLEVRQGV